IIVGLVLLAAIGATLSRGAWLALSAGIAVWCLAGVRQRRLWNAKFLGVLAVLGALVAVVLAWWNPGGILAGLQDRLLNQDSSAERLFIWKTSLALFQENPLLGLGPDTFQLAFASRRTLAFWFLEWNTIPTRAHNEILQVL